MRVLPFDDLSSILNNRWCARVLFFTAAVFVTIMCAADTIAVEVVDLCQRQQFVERHMGTRFVIVVYAPVESRVEEAVSQAFLRVAELDAKLSNYRSDSELNRFCRRDPHAGPQPVGHDLWNMLVQGQALAEQTVGAFDITVGPLTKLWRRAHRRQQLPSPDLLAEAKKQTGYQHLLLDETTQRAQLKRPHMQIDLGAIAKGYAADEALSVLQKHGWTSASVDAGGDFALADPPPGKAGWQIAIKVNDEKRSVPVTLTLANQGVATSGDLWQFVEIEGRRYSHIVDPRTGLGLTTQTSATVVAPTCVMADSLASAAVVLGPDKALEWLEGMSNVEARIVTPYGQLATSRFEDK
ncbi:MAG: FAD:protein FMN transferase [Pirellulaceae bacterium]|nr:FAD:protein FMN transferase [Pirellulaceae bacterium]